MPVKPDLHSTNMANVSVDTEADLAGLPVRTYPNGTTIWANDTQTLYVWDSFSTAVSVPGVSVAVSTGGAWISIGSSVSVGVNTVTGAGNSLKNLVPAGPSAVIVKGYSAAGDGGGGLFYWDSVSTATDNGGTIIRPTAVLIGAWIRIFTGAFQAQWWGAKFDNVTDDTTAIQNAINSMGNIVNGIVGNELQFPNGIAVISATINIDRKCGKIRGLGTGVIITGTGTAFRWNGAAAQDMFLITRCQGLEFGDFRCIGKGTAVCSSAINMNCTVGDSPANSDIVLSNIWIGHIATEVSIIGFTKGIITSGANIQDDQSVMRHITFQNVTDACIDLANSQNTTWHLDHIIINACDYGVRVGTRYVKATNIFQSSVLQACYHFSGDGMIKIENFGHEGCSRFALGSTGACFWAENGYFQSDITRIPVDNAIINISTAGFVLILTNVGFTRSGAFAAGQEKIKVRSSNFIFQSTTFSFPDALESAHFDFAGQGAGDKLWITWGQENYFNAFTQGDATTIGNRNDIETDLRIKANGNITQLGTGYYAQGNTPATTGDIRLKNNFIIKCRNAGNSADFPLINVDATDIFNIGDTSLQLTLVSKTVFITYAQSAYKFGVGDNAVATTGDYRLNRNTQFKIRNAANSADILMFDVATVADQLTIWQAGNDIRINFSKIGFNVAPITTPVDVGALTDNTGGTVNGTLVDVGAVFSQANINDNFADCADRINKIRTTLRSLGLMQ